MIQHTCQSIDPSLNYVAASLANTTANLKQTSIILHIIKKYMYVY